MPGYVIADVDVFDLAGFEIAGPYPAHPTLVGHVAQHRARPFERAHERPSLFVAKG